MTYQTAHAVEEGHLDRALLVGKAPLPALGRISTAGPFSSLAGPMAMSAATTTDTPARQSLNRLGDGFLFDLAPGWAVGFDDLQWMLMRVVKRKPSDRRSPWVPVAFVATERRILDRVIRDRGITVTADGRAHLDALPDHFKTFITTKEFAR